MSLHSEPKAQSLEAAQSAERCAPVAPPYSDRLASAFVAAVPPPLPPPRLYQQVARCEALFVQLAESGLLGHRGLLWLGTMEGGERELVILRTTARMRAGYEWSVHVAYFGRGSGLTDRQIAATCEAASPADLWSRRQEAILRLVDTVLAAPADEPHSEIGGDPVSDRLWEELRVELSEPEIIEMVTLCGMYRTVSTLATMLRTAGEPNTPVFPGWTVAGMPVDLPGTQL